MTYSQIHTQEYQGYSRFQNVDQNKILYAEEYDTGDGTYDLWFQW